MKVAAGTRVEIHYRLYDQGGELVESSEPGEPVRFVQGAEEILPGLERALEGCEPGGDLRVELGPQEAYGDYNPEGLVYVPRADFPPDLVLEPGTWVTVGLEDVGTVDEEGDEMEMCIVEVHDREVVLDANHPLAGQSVTFEVEVVSVASAGVRGRS